MSDMLQLERENARLLRMNLALRRQLAASRSLLAQHGILPVDPEITELDFSTMEFLEQSAIMGV